MILDGKGFTLIELLIGTVILCVVILIALPMYAMRGKKTEQLNARAQLQCIREAEESYRSRHGSYTADASKLANWKQRTKKYTFLTAADVLRLMQVLTVCALMAMKEYPLEVFCRSRFPVVLMPGVKYGKDLGV